MSTDSPPALSTDPPAPARSRARCTGPDCRRAVHAESLCKTHYMQRRRGRVLSPIALSPRSRRKGLSFRVALKLSVPSFIALGSVTGRPMAERLERVLDAWAAGVALPPFAEPPPPVDADDLL